MPALGRNGSRLLRTVGNKPHATSEDHDETRALKPSLRSAALPTPPTSSGTPEKVTRSSMRAIKTFDSPLSSERADDTDSPEILSVNPVSKAQAVEEDWTRDPLSSDDERDDKQTAKPQSRQKSALPSKYLEVEDDFTRSPVSSSEEDNGTALKKSSDLEKLSNSIAQSARGTKRASQDSDDEPIFRSQPKRPKSQESKFKKPALKITYGSQSSQQMSDRAKSSSKFKKAKVQTQSKSTKKVVPTFKQARGADIFMFGKDSPAAEKMPSPLSSGLSSPPGSPELEEVEVLVLSQGTVPKIRCDICRQPVDLLLKQEYEDRYSTGRSMNIARQNAFCKYHHRRAAEEEWELRAYPKINWDRLERRMKQHHPRLISILHGETASTFREELAKDIANRAAISFKAAQTSAAMSKISAGYYGPRGQKLMLEHISNHLSEELRRASTKNDLISATGMTGGVAGFVQIVLVPELAVSLISEDMMVTPKAAEKVLRDSKAIGESLHEEEREVVLDDDDDEPS